MNKKFFKSVVLLAIATLFASSCGALFLSQDKKGGVSREGLVSLGLLGNTGESGNFAGSGRVGPAGGTLQSNDGTITVYIPAGAMKEEVEFTITRYSPSSRSMPRGYLPTAAAYEFTPSYRFDKDITIKMKPDMNFIKGLNLEQAKSSGFIYSSTSLSDDSGRLPGWTASAGRFENDQIVFTSRTFSIFGTGTPPPGNQPPNIVGAFYYFKSGLRFVPYRVRANVIEPDGDPMNVYLLVGPAGGVMNTLPMTREGGTNWYRADIPYEAMATAGITMQILAVDSWGNYAKLPDNPFNFPADSGVPAFNNYNPDRDGDGILDAWEADNGYNPRNPSDTSALTDTDGDGIPDAADPTPNGEANPQIDSLTIIPAAVQMDVGETVSFGAMASYLGQPRFVTPTYAATGSGAAGTPVGSMTGSSFTANNPGIAGVSATVDLVSSTATVVVWDTVAPSNITDLSAIAMNYTQVRLNWTAPGDDSTAGRASAYEIRRSTSAITDDASCDAAAYISHSLTPKSGGLPESLDVMGHSPNTTYYYCIRAFDSDGNRSSWSGTVSATTQAVPDQTPPANITGATAAPNGANAITLSWTAVGDDGNTGSASYYEVRRSANLISDDASCDQALSVLTTTTPVVAGTPMTYDVRGLAGETQYFFCIRAFDDVNNRSSWTGTLTATTPSQNMAPVVEAGPDQTIMLSRTVNLSANDTVDPDVSYCNANTANYIYSWTLQSKPLASALTNADITGANTATPSFVPDAIGSYTLQLLFTDDPGTCWGGARTGMDTLTITVIPMDLIAPADVTGATAEVLTYDQIRLNWTAVGDDDTTGTPVKYEIRIHTLPIWDDATCSAAPDSRTITSPPAAGTAMSYVVTGLQHSTKYYFCIRAYDEVDNRGSWPVDVVQGTTLEGIAGWSNWSAFSACSVTCGGGTKFQTRVCLDSSLGCAGSDTNTISCNPQACDSFWLGVVRTNSASISQSCPAGYHAGVINCGAGSYKHWGYDDWGEPWACGAILRFDNIVGTSVTNRTGVGTSTGTCYYSTYLPPPVARCQGSSVNSSHYIQVRCNQTP